MIASRTFKAYLEKFFTLKTISYNHVVKAITKIHDNPSISWSEYSKNNYVRTIAVAKVSMLVAEKTVSNFRRYARKIKTMRKCRLKKI